MMARHRATPNMTCPNCGPTSCSSYNTRIVEINGTLAVRRQRQCSECRSNFFTVEVPEKSLKSGDSRILTQSGQTLLRDLFSQISAELFDPGHRG